MDGSEVESEDYTSESSYSEEKEDLTELCAFVKYNKEFRREGRALIYIPDNYVLTEYKDGKCERGYALHGNNCLKEVTFENNEIVQQTVIPAIPGMLRDPTGTLEFDGYIQDDSPMGFGSCKDIASNQVIYQGYMIGWERNIEGISMKDNKKVYNGNWCANKRCGYGIEYDEKEMILREGYWFDDEFIQSSLFLANPLNPTMSKWKVNNSMCSEVLDLSGFQELEEITFNSNSFETIGIVNITGLQKLRKIEFEAKSFSMCGYSNSKRSLRISDCPLLESIDIERYCFTDYTHFELSNLDSLETLIIGSIDNDSFNFYEASFSIEDLPKLRMIHLGTNAFIYANRTVFKNLPALEEILLGDYALQGPNSDDCSLEMCNLPVLKSFSSSGHSFWNVKTASLKDLPHECAVHLPISFRRCSNIQYSNVAFRLT